MTKCIPNPEFHKAVYEYEFIYADGRTFNLPYAPRYATVEDAREEKNPIYSHMIVESNDS